MWFVAKTAGCMGRRVSPLARCAATVRARIPLPGHRRHGPGECVLTPGTGPR